MIKLFVLPQISVIHESRVILNVAPWFESCHFPCTLWTTKTKRLNIDFEPIIGVNSIQSSKELFQFEVFETETKAFLDSNGVKIDTETIV